MISKTLRAYNVQHGYYPSVFIYQDTPSGMFYLSEIEAEISTDLTPIEKLALSLVEDLGTITRIEMYALSGISVEICDEDLEEMQKFGLLSLCKFDRDKLEENVEKLSKELGDEWVTPHIKSLMERKILKQYEITQTGRESLQNLKKKIRDTTEIHAVITGKPFYMFQEEMDLKPDGYENISTTPQLVQQVLTFAEDFSEYTGLKPLSIGSNSVVEGKEVANSQFWISMEGNGTMKLQNSNFNMYLSSSTFNRWANPNWNDYLRSLVPEVETIDELVINSMSETYEMVEEVIEEGLTLSEDKITWILEVDLEMIMLIYNVMTQPIEEIKAEIVLDYPGEEWKSVILLQLEPWDDLADRALKAGRFHENVPKKGFNLEEGYQIWSKIMKEWEKDVKRSDYKEGLETLLEFDCLIERQLDVRKLIVDVENILEINRRGSQKWEFNRLRELKNILDEQNIEDVIYYVTERIHGKIDEPDNLQQWIDDEILEIHDTDEEEKVVQIARQLKSHYLGNNGFYLSDNEEREYGRSLNVEISKKRLRIPKLEPFYDWRQENLFNKMFDVYYE